MPSSHPELRRHDLVLEVKPCGPGPGGGIEIVKGKCRAKERDHGQIRAIDEAGRTPQYLSGAASMDSLFPAQG